MGFFRNLLRAFAKPAPETEPAPPKASETATAAPVVAATPAPSDRRRRVRIDARRGTRILVIDDSATVIAVFKKILASKGYVVYEALDAESGIDLARTHGPEIIFLDIILPGMDGFAALRHIRRDPRTKDIPVIMISGNELAAEQFYANRIGADDFMKKPFTRADVFTRIEPLLDERLIPRRTRHHPPH